MKLFNGELDKFVTFLFDLELDGKASRMRTRFMKLAQERLEEVEKERQRLISQYSKKDSEGNPLTDVRDGLNVIILEDAISFETSFKELLLEAFILDNTEERRDMLLALKDAVLNTTMKFKGQDALLYDRWCEVVEEIIY